MRHRPAAKVRLARTDARRRIIIAANRHKVSQMHYTMKNLNECVAMCRRRQLVKPSVIEAAGFRL